MKAINQLYKTRFLKAKEIDKKWWLLDAKDLVLGRMASEVAKILRGKHKASFTPHLDCGDNVIIINTNQVKLTGQKWAKKTYISHTGYPGGQKSTLAKDLHAKNPTLIVQKALKNMLPKNKLGRKLMGNVRIYADANYQEQGQQPQELKLNL